MLEILTGNYAYRILGLIHGASKSIRILSYVMNFNMYKRSDKASIIFFALAKFASDKGTVEIVLDYPRAHKPNYNCNKFSSRRLLERGIAIRFLKKGTSQHAKLFLFDSSIAVTGSHNLTRSSVINNYDISVLLDSQKEVATLDDLFTVLWSESIEV